jgi:hypothetical protein
MRTVDLLRQAIDPDFAGGWNNLGNTFVQATGRWLRRRSQ